MRASHAHVGRRQRALAHRRVDREQVAPLEVSYRGLQHGIVELRFGAAVRREIAAGEQSLAQDRYPRRALARTQRGAVGDRGPAAARGDVAVRGQAALEALVERVLRSQPFQRRADVARGQCVVQQREGVGAEPGAVQRDVRLDVERVELAVDVVGREADQRIAAQQLHAGVPRIRTRRGGEQRIEVVVGGQQALALRPVHGGEQPGARRGIRPCRALRPHGVESLQRRAVAHAGDADAQFPVLRQLRQRSRQGVVGAQRGAGEGRQQQGEKPRVQDAEH